MKFKILLFVIGVLVGGIIATGSFYVYTTAKNSCDIKSINNQMFNGKPPEMSSGQNNDNEPLEKPGGKMTDKSNDNSSQNNVQDNNS